MRFTNTGFIALVIGLILAVSTPVIPGEGPTHGATEDSKWPTPDTPYVRVFVSKTGVVSVDGKQVTLDELDAALVDLQDRHGVVLYTRDAPHKDPHPKAMEVIRVIGGKKLPIRMCNKRDFSDALRPDGKLKVE